MPVWNFLSRQALAPLAIDSVDWQSSTCTTPCREIPCRTWHSPEERYEKKRKRHHPTRPVPDCSFTDWIGLTKSQPNVDAGSSLRWLSPSTMALYYHFDSTSDPEPQNTNQAVWVYLFEATAICPLTAYQCAQALYICIMWIQEAVWGGCQPQPWRNDIILTPQVTQNPKIWPKLGGYNC